MATVINYFKKLVIGIIKVYSITVLEIRSLKSVSLGQNQGVDRIMSSRGSRENLFLA